MASDVLPYSPPQLYVPDEDKSIFGRSVNKQVFDGLTTGLLQTICAVLGPLWPPLPDQGRGDVVRICSPESKTKGLATDSFSTRVHDLLRYPHHPPSSSHPMCPRVTPFHLECVHLKCTPLVFLWGR